MAVLPAPLAPRYKTGKKFTEGSRVEQITNWIASDGESGSKHGTVAATTLCCYYFFLLVVSLPSGFVVLIVVVVVVNIDYRLHIFCPFLCVFVPFWRHPCIVKGLDCSVPSEWPFIFYFSITRSVRLSCTYYIVVVLFPVEGSIGSLCVRQRGISWGYQHRPKLR